MCNQKVLFFGNISKEPVKIPITLFKMTPLEGTRVAKVSSQFTAISEILKGKCLGKEEARPPSLPHQSWVTQVPVLTVQETRSPVFPLPN